MKIFIMLATLFPSCVLATEMTAWTDEADHYITSLSTVQRDLGVVVKQMAQQKSKMCGRVLNTEEIKLLIQDDKTFFVALRYALEEKPEKQRRVIENMQCDGSNSLIINEGVK